MSCGENIYWLVKIYCNTTKNVFGFPMYDHGHVMEFESNEFAYGLLIPFISTGLIIVANPDNNITIKQIL